jgi:glycosyltransferase involved in cell wall biosynthesis
MWRGAIGGGGRRRVTEAGRPVRVLFINRSYWPDMEATGQFLTELCEDLAAEFDLHVLCGRPQRSLETAEAAAYGACTRHGVTIQRLRHTQFDKASFWGRLVNMVTFLISAAWQSMRVPRPDITVVETDPPLLCLLGRLLEVVRGTRLVCYLQDIYPDVAVALGKLRRGWVERVLRRMFLAVYRRSSAVIVLSRDMRDMLLSNGVPGDTVHTIPNWADTDKIYPVKSENSFRRSQGLDDKFVVMYSGNMGMSQRLEQLLEAADLLRDRQDIVFAMVGNGVDRRNLERDVAAKRLSNVRFYDYQPKSALADSLSAADVHLVILRPEIKQLLMPSKLYGVMASGTPSIVLADANCELAEVVRQQDAGVVVPSESTGALVAAICDSANSPERVRRQGVNARRYAEAHCRREASVAQISTLLHELSGLAAGAASKSSIRENAAFELPLSRA